MKLKSGQHARPGLLRLSPLMWRLVAMDQVECLMTSLFSRSNELLTGVSSLAGAGAASRLIV